MKKPMQARKGWLAGNGRRAVGIAAGATCLCLAVAAAWQQVACAPFPSSPGYVSVAQGNAGKVDLSIHAAVLCTGEIEKDVDCAYGGGGGVTVEPHPDEKLSIPITLSGGGRQGGGTNAGGGTLRLGLRHRSLPWLGVGAGLSGGIYGWGSGGMSDFYGSAIIDMEAFTGFEKDRVGLSFVIRPSLSFGINMDDGPARYFFLPMDLALAVFVVPGRVAVTFHGGGGFFTIIDEHPYWNGWVGGGLGLYVRL